MHWTNIGLILVAGLDLGVALLIWLRNPRHKINVSLAIAIFFLAVWTFGSGMMREAVKIETAIFWARVLNIGGIVLIIPFFLFSVYFPYQSFVLHFRSKIIIFLSMILILFVLFTPNFYFFNDGITLDSPNNNYSFNHGFKIFVTYFLSYLFWAYLNLIRKLRTSQGYIRSQLLYIITGTGVTALFGTLFGAISPLFFEGRYFWIGPYFALPLVIILVYFSFYYHAR